MIKRKGENRLVIRRFRLHSLTGELYPEDKGENRHGLLMIVYEALVYRWPMMPQQQPQNSAGTWSQLMCRLIRLNSFKLSTRIVN